MSFLQKNDDLIKIKRGRIKNVMPGFEPDDVVTYRQLTSSSGVGSNKEDTQTITGTTMVLTQTPTFIYGVFLNGQRLTLTVDYTVSGATITFLVALVADSVTVSYKY
ncbi:hypothetical protein CCP3SC1AL1_510007 [Gammaproteobacteria bacterium]